MIRDKTSYSEWTYSVIVLEGKKLISSGQKKRKKKDKTYKKKYFSDICSSNSYCWFAWG